MTLCLYHLMEPYPPIPIPIPTQYTHRLKLDLPSVFGSCVQLCSLAETPQLPSLAFALLYEGAISQPRKTTSLCNPLPKQLQQNSAFFGPKWHKKVSIFRVHRFQWPSKWICPHQNNYSRAINNRYTLIVTLCVKDSPIVLYCKST
jgi:hypothetical protein